jgi:hypothetical protein
VIDDDVLDHIHPSGVGLADQLLQIPESAESRIDLQEILDAVAVIAVGLLPPILEDGAQPDHVRAEPLDVIQAAGDASKIPTLEQLALFGLPASRG